MDDGEARIVWECPWWAVEEREFRGTDDVARRWYTARRPNPDTVHMLGLTPQGMVPVLRQWRVPLQAEVWELPAGLCDVPGETLEQTARRELLEETGYRAGEVRHLFRGTVSPGITNELYHAFLCLNLERVGNGEGLGGERISVHLVPFAGLEQFVMDAQARGELVDAKILAHVMLARRALE